MNLHLKRNKCRLCCSEKLDMVVALKPVPVGEHYSDSQETLCDKRFPIDIYQCKLCKAVQTLDDIDSKFLWDGYTYFSGQTGGILNHFEQFTKDLFERYSLGQDLRVFDIGSNDGSLLTCFKKKGCTVYGIDPSDIVASVAIKSGIPTYVGLFSDKSIKYFPKESRIADVITAFNVFAHSPDMGGMIKGVKDMLSPEGIFCFEVQYLGDISQKKLIGTIFHEHMIHYSLSAAKYFLESNGMRLLDYSRNNIQMGSIIFYATHEKSKKITSNSVSELEALEKSSGIVDPTWAKEFSLYIEEQRNQVKKLRYEWAQKDLIVAGYGAARAGPTLAIQFGLEGCISYLLDDHPSKSGKYGVFEGLRVFPTSRLLADGPDVAIILAWIHTLNIVKNNINYLKKGGRFIALWPKVIEINIDNVYEWIDLFKKSK